MVAYRDGMQRYSGGTQRNGVPEHLSYIYASSPPSPTPVVGVKQRTIGPEGRPAPYQPATTLTQADIDGRYGHGAFENFHAPWNEHGRNTTTVSTWERNDYRELERMAPFPHDKIAVGLRQRRASSAPRTRSASLPVPQGTTLMDNMTTLTGVPIYTVDAVIEADLNNGTPVVDRCGRPAWQVARVQTYKVPPVAVGYGAGGTRPFHQDYRHYKYFGFAGKGAKTSWGHNPKMSERDAGGQTIQAQAQAVVANAAAMPLQEYIGGPNRPLTATERQLVAQFRTHSYSAEGTPSGSGPQVKGGSTCHSHQVQAAEGRRLMTAGSPHYALPPAERIEPYMETVNMVDRFPVDAHQPHQLTSDEARVATYRQPAPTGYTQAENPSPNMGSQSPFHQRYIHYKYHGFAGKGATSSWARNPKMAIMYDHQ